MLSAEHGAIPLEFVRLSIILDALLGVDYERGKPVALTLTVPACRFDFCMAPAQIRDSRQAAALLHFAARYANGMPVTLDINIPRVMPITAEQLRHMEATHQVSLLRLPLVSLQAWLPLRVLQHNSPICTRHSSSACPIALAFNVLST